MDKFHKTQLCWTCSRACGGCSWSDGSYTPVKGWKAKKNTVRVEKGIYSHEYDSYHITECPLYDNDTPVEKRNEYESDRRLRLAPRRF